MTQSYKRLSTRLIERLPGWARQRLVLGQVKFDAEKLSGVVLRIPNTLVEYDASAQLLFDSYTDARIIANRGVRVRMSAFLALPTSVRFVAVDRGEVVGTISLVIDSPLGLPMEKTYPEEIAALRQQQRKAAEVGTLAIRKDHRHSGIVVLLYKAMWEVATLLQVSDFVIGVHPNAEVIYRTMLCFEPFGPVRNYLGLKDGIPAAALRLDLRSMADVWGRRFAGAQVPSPPPFFFDPEHQQLRDLRMATEERGQKFPGARRFNPWSFFREVRHEQLRLPRSVAEWEATRDLHQKATLRLLALRPDVLVNLTESEFSLLSQSIAGPGLK